jgi:hypothetical protein
VKRLVALAFVFLALHLPYLPASLEDHDSINFALGLRRFDVPHHQPHPPGYPLFILAAHVARRAAGSEAKALAAVSLVGGALGVLAIGALLGRIAGTADSGWMVFATATAVSTPLYWFTAVRPLSDSAGLAASVGVQALTMAAATTRGWAAAGFLAGLATGVRSQVAWLTVPLLIYRLWREEGRGQAAGAAGQRWTRGLVAAVALVAGALVWAIPLVALSGGPASYWHALFDQGAEDFGGIRTLWSTPTARELFDAFYYAGIAPWATWPAASLALTLAATGVVTLLGRDRRPLMLLLVAFGPYLLLDILFQETFTSRYALPLVIPVAYLATEGARALPRRSGALVLIALVMFDSHVGGTAIAAYSRQTAPAFRLLDDMRAAARSMPELPVLAMDRREDLDLKRPMTWLGDAMPGVAQHLSAPPQHEWLELVRYWNGGGRAPVWLVADPKRAAVDLIGRAGAARSMYRWNLPYPVLIDGVRPNEMDWYRIARPEWYVGNGWALTPEAAGVSAADGLGLASGAIEAWVARDPRGVKLVVGGRNLEPIAGARVSVTADGLSEDEWQPTPGFFLRFVTLRLAAPRGDGLLDYAKLQIQSTPPARVAIEQFDASATRALFGYGDGWHEAEFNPDTGRRWRWLSERGELQYHVGPASARLRLHLEGESPLTYFPRGSRLIVRAGGAGGTQSPGDPGRNVVFDRILSADFSVDVAVPGAGPSGGDRTITLETDQVFVPAERNWRRSDDRRHLGLRIFRCEFVPAS